tara:strand:+ start:42 stop:272 length:231 start_codon:yes stop_codon:yes gene_type:complete
MSRLKDQCIEVELKFNEYLKDLTNDQAIAKINDEYGPSHAFACATQIKEFIAQDNQSQSEHYEDVNYPNKKKVRTS